VTARAPFPCCGNQAARRSTEGSALSRKRHGFDLDRLDGAKNAPFFGMAGACAHGQRIPRCCRAGVELDQPIELALGGGHDIGAVEPHLVAQGNRAVRQAAAEVDGIALLDAVELVDRVERTIDLADALQVDSGEHEVRAMMTPKPSADTRKISGGEISVLRRAWEMRRGEFVKTIEDVRLIVFAVAQVSAVPRAPSSGRARRR
jgi:hypothetical protein